MKIQIAPSILSADFGKINEEIASIEPYADMIHLDVMDGRFVDNITFGQTIVRCLKTSLPMDCHLMIENPEKHIKGFVDAGVSSLTIHQEVCPHLHKIIYQIKSFGIKAGVSLNPSTPVDTLVDVLDDIDLVLVMSVNPGAGGQKFINRSLEKIKKLRLIKPSLDIEVDGGINSETAKLCIDAGANILVAGSYIFKAKDRKEAILSLRG